MHENRVNVPVRGNEWFVFAGADIDGGVRIDHRNLLIRQLPASTTDVIARTCRLSNDCIDGPYSVVSEEHLPSAESKYIEIEESISGTILPRIFSYF
jgi:hypothetical protein